MIYRINKNVFAKWKRTGKHSHFSYIPSRLPTKMEKHNQYRKNELRYVQKETTGMVKTYRFPIVGFVCTIVVLCDVLFYVAWSFV